MNAGWKLGTLSAAVALALLTSACGGGGGGSSDTNNTGTAAGSSGSSSGSSSSSSSSSGGATAATVAGTAAFGAPMAGATINILDATGKALTATAGSDGSYSFDATGLSAPVLLTASVISGDTVKHYSALLTSLPAAGQTSTANVTPLTNAVVALASSTGFNAGEFADASKLQALDASKLQKATDTVKALVANVATDAGLPSDFNPVSTPLAATVGTPGDKLLETVKVTLTESGVTLTNALSPVASGASGASATVTVKDVSSIDTSTLTSLPKPTVVNSYDTLLATLRTQLNNCLAQAPSARVNLDSNNNVISLKGECTAAKLSAFDAAYLSGGLDLVGRWGPRLRDLPQGSIMGQAEVLGTFARGSVIELMLRLPFSVQGGGTAYAESLRTDGSGAFKLLGNQLKYDFDIGARLYRVVDKSAYDRIGTGGADQGKDVGKLSHWETALAPHFNLNTPTAAKVYAARITGPGMPAAGLVLSRGFGCGTGGELKIYSSDGSLPTVPTGATTAFMSTLGGGSTWRLSATPLGSDYTGSNLFNEVRGWTSSAAHFDGHSPAIYPATPYDVTTIPELAAYTVEVFSVDNPGVAETMTVNMTDRPVGPEFGNVFNWATVDAGALDYINPSASNPKAAALSNATIAFTNHAGAPLVSFASLAGTGQGTHGEAVRFSMGETVAPVGASTMTVAQAAETDGVGNVCATSTVPAHNALVGSRQVQIEQIANRVKMIQVWSSSGRSLVTPPAGAAGSTGWNVFTADTHPLSSGSLVMADGLLGQFSLTGATATATTYYGSVASGLLNFDSSTGPDTDTQAYRFDTVVNRSASYPKTLTLLARVTGNATATARVMDFAMAFSDVGSSGTKIPVVVRENAGVRGISVNGSSVSAQSAPFDTSATHIYQIAVTLTSAKQGEVKVYVDGAATPAVDMAADGSTVSFSPVAALGDNYVSFGDNYTSAGYKSSLDWMVWTNTGAYTPAQLAGKLPSSLGTVTGY